jgi:hypothetical protein
LGHANKVLIIIAFSFRQFLADFSIFEKEQKSKAIAFTFRLDCEQSLYLLFPGLRLNARENGKKGRRREEK